MQTKISVIAHKQCKVKPCDCCSMHAGLDDQKVSRESTEEMATAGAALFG